MEEIEMLNTNFINKIKIFGATVFALSFIFASSQNAEAQFNKIENKVKKAVATSTDASQTTDDSSNSASLNSDVEETISNAYVFYLSKVAGFEARFHNAAEVTKQAHDYASKLDAALRANPSYRTRKIAPIVRDDSTEMTAADLLDKLNHAGEIIGQGQSDLQSQSMSYFVQGDVDDWKNRTDKLDANDGFILLANHEYPLLFNRAEGEKQMLARYSKSNGNKPLPASVITPLHNQIDELLAKMNDLAPQFTFSGVAKPVEPFIVAFIKNQAVGNIPGATVLKTSWTNDPWLIDKNDVGVPTLRRRLGTALYRVPDQKFCVEQHFFYHEAYAGGGSYQRGADVIFSDLRFVKCQ